jgi:hypothetical protein
VDILGFEQFVRDNPTRVLDYGPDEQGITGSGTTPLQTRINRFQWVLDGMVREQELYGGVSAMIFSDCAYLDWGTTLRAAMVAVDLMREFNAFHVPVRMGIGRGTFYGFKYSMENCGNANMVMKALFAGTAVVNAHAAEQCGEAGCRIFLHPSAEDQLQLIRDKFPVLPLTRPSDAAHHELCYFYKDQTDVEVDSENNPRLVDRDAEMLNNLKVMRADSHPSTARALQQFTDTLEAFERMLRVLGRTMPEDLGLATHDSQETEPANTQS